MKKRITSLFMAVIMLLVCTVPASASSFIDSERNTPIGTLADEDGILLADTGARASGLPFSMRAVNVKNLLTTYSASGKNFTGGAFDVFEGTGLLIKGTLTHSHDTYTKVGACYYMASSDTFYSVSPQYFPSGEEFTAWIPKESGKYLLFFNYETYYGHITNHSNVGTVSGTLNFSVSKDPFLIGNYK